MTTSARQHTPGLGPSSLGRGAGLGFLGSLALIGLLSSCFVLWALSCLGGAACELVRALT